MADSTTDVVLRPATLEDMDTVAERAYRAGWTFVSKHKTRAFYACDPDGWIIAENQSNNKCIGSVFGCNFGNSMATMGYLIVDAEYRKTGIGSQLMKACHDYLNDAETIILYATDFGYQMYLRRGYSIIRSSYCKYIMKVPESIDIPNNNNHSDVEIVKMSSEMLEDVLEYDTKVHTTSRAGFIRAFLNPDEVTTVLARKNGVACGYGCVGKMHGSLYLIAPLYGESSAIAHSIFCTLVSTVPPGQRTMFRCFEDNATMGELAKQFKADVQNKIPCMMKGKIPKIPLDSVYCIVDTGFGLV